MTDKKLQYFITVAKTENMSEAARQLYIAQPALSKSIADLEKEVGFPLFDRVGKRLVLNSSGKLYLDYAMRAQLEKENILQKLKDNNGISDNIIKLGVCSCSQLLGDIIAGFYKDHPEANIEIRASFPLDFTDKDFDLIIDSDMKATNPRAIKLASERMMLAFSKESNVREILEKRELDKLFALPLIMPSDDSRLGQILNDYYRQYRESDRFLYEYDYAIQINNSFVQCALAGQNIGITIVPEKTWAPAYTSNNLDLEPLGRDLTRDIYLLINSNKYQTKLLLDFVEYLKNYFAAI